MQGLTWLLPEKFSASEIGPEAGFFVILLVTIFIFFINCFPLLETLNCIGTTRPVELSVLWAPG